MGNRSGSSRRTRRGTTWKSTEYLTGVTYSSLHVQKHGKENSMKLTHKYPTRKTKMRGTKWGVSRTDRLHWHEKKALSQEKASRYTRD